MGPEVLGHYWGRHNAADPTSAAVDNMYRIMRVKAGKETREVEQLARRIKWEELVCVMENLEKDLGWEPQDGTKAYTSDRAAAHKSMVLGKSMSTRYALTVGEGYRTFDKSGNSDR